MADVVIFTKRDFDKLKEGERLIHDILPIIDKAEECGVECDEFRAVAKELQRRFQAIETQFMTPPPTK